VKVFDLGDGRGFGLGPQIAVVLLVVGLAGAMAIEPTRQLLEQRSRIAGMHDELKAIDESNDRLQKRVTQLQNPDYLEQQARLHSGLVRPGERSVVVMPPAEDDDPERESRVDRTRAPSEDPGLLDSMMGFLGFN
jgi:cell division protein FtsB